MKKMQDKKLICTDLDGTLLFRNNNEDGSVEVYIKDEDREALQKLRQEGHVIAVVTGREKQGIRAFLQESKIAFDYYVGTNGSLILNQHFEKIQQTFLPADVVGEIITYLNLHHPEVSMMATDGFMLWFFEGIYENAQIKSFDRDMKILQKDEYDEAEHSFIMMNVNLDEKYKGDKTAKIDQIQKELEENFGNQMNFFRNQDFIDFAPLGCSKGHAVREIAEMLKIPIQSVYTIGDSWNDLSMFEIGANSYTFKHADKALQEKTDHVVETFADMADKI